MNDRQALIASMFDVESFRSTGHQLIELLANDLADNLQGKGKVLDWQPPLTEDLLWRSNLPHDPVFDTQGLMRQLEQQILPGNLAIHHPRNLGHQVATPLPIAALCDLVAALTNQAMAVYETGPSATMLERQVLRWLSELIGWNTSAGVLTSGGAQANLTALLAARQHCANWDVWQHGLSGQPALCLLASEHAHYSISRAAGIMGLGSQAVIKISTDAQGCMSMDALESAYDLCKKNGQRIIAVVASAGCTPTGSIDPLQSIGTFCRKHQLWMHVDGAHGASALLSEEYRPLLKGIELADSVVWDGHKLLYMPATVSAVIFRDPQTSHSAFAQDASYLFNSGKQEAEQFNISSRTLECTKRMMALKLWAAFCLYGLNGIAALVDEAFAKAREFAKLIESQRDFELLTSPQTNILCFRHTGLETPQQARNSKQADIRKAIVESGAFHLTQVEIHGVLWLRTTLMNPFTQISDCMALLDLIRTHASSQ